MTFRGGISWLSSSSTEIARARDVLKALKPGGVIDELGFLVLFGAFADRLYPATNTVMTRARYLVFVPAIYKYLEESRSASGKDTDRVARDLQFNLSKALLKNETRAIGRDSGRDIIRPPSDIYWNALAELRIATQRVSEASYQERLSEDLVGRRVVHDDDKAAHPADGDSLWDANFRLSHVLPGGVFPANTSFRLRKAEATQLQQRYAKLRPDGRESMLTHLVRLGERHGPKSLEAITYVWDAPNVPAALVGIVHHARLLSLFARGVTLQYHRMLIEKLQKDSSGASNAFRAWWQIARIDLRDWKLDEFFALICAWGAERRSLHDREFIEGWIQRCLAATSAKQALEDSRARDIITQREAEARPGKRRLRVKHHLESWGMPKSYPTDDHYLMGYRHDTGQQFAQDIAEGLLRGAS
jgi:hypothetical protein